MKEKLKIAKELCKVRISLPVALSAITGYVLFLGEIGLRGWGLGLGVFLMSCSSSVVNHWQERNIDAQMPRTRMRPIPSGRISARKALIWAVVLALGGSALLLAFQPFIAFILSWATLFFYNGVYTPLKKVSAFAVIPGSMVGALPPVIGWAAAGGNPTSELILLVAAFFFIGQIPHFWLLLLMFGEQYQQAHLPSLNQIFDEVQIKRVTYVWVLTTIASAFLVIFFVVGSQIIMFLLLFYSFYLLASVSIAVFAKHSFNVRASFYKLNFLYLFMMIFLIVDSLVRA